MKNLISHWRACGALLVIFGLFPFIGYSQEKPIVFLPRSKEISHAENRPKKVLASYNFSLVIEREKVDVDAVKKLADEGDAEAIRKLAIMYLNGGDGINKNLKKAHELLLKAAKLGDEYAKNLCLELQEKVLAENVAADFDQWLKKAELGNAELQKSVAFAYRDGIGVDKNEKEFFKWISAAAKQGDAYAQYKLADAYLNGIGTEENLEESFSWYKKSADNGLSFAYGAVGNAYRLGSGVPADLKKAFSFYEKGAALGDPQSEISLGVMYVNGNVVEADYEKAISLFERAGTQEWSSGYLNIGYIYFKILEDEEKALSYYRKAIAMGDKDALKIYTNIISEKEMKKALEKKIADLTERSLNGDADAMLELADCKENGVGTPKDMEGALALYEQLMAKNNADAFYRAAIISIGKDEQKGVEYMKKAVELGNGEAANYLGEYYLKKPDANESFRYFKIGADLGHANSMYNCFIILYSNNMDAAEALKYLNMSAEKSHPFACMALGIFYMKGMFGVNVDFEKALLYLSKGAKEGSDDAMVVLSELFELGLLGETDKEQAFFWAEKAAQKNNMIGILKVGLFLLQGYGVEPDPKRGFKLIEHCAANNLPAGILSLGDCYYFGDGVEKNEKEAYLNWKKSADLGYNVARHRIVVANQDGIYIPKDINKAVALARELAEENDSYGQYMLAVYLEEEEGFRDEVESLAWFIVAEKNGEKCAPERLKKLKERMTPENIAAAEAKSAEIMKKL